MLDFPLMLQVKLPVDRICHIVKTFTELIFSLERLPLTQTALAWAVCFPITDHGMFSRENFSFMNLFILNLFFHTYKTI